MIYYEIPNIASSESSSARTAYSRNALAFSRLLFLHVYFQLFSSMHLRATLLAREPVMMIEKVSLVIAFLEQMEQAWSMKPACRMGPTALAQLFQKSFLPIACTSV